MIKVPLAPTHREDSQRWVVAEEVNERPAFSIITDVNDCEKSLRHELLGSRVLGNIDTDNSWWNELDLKEVSWLFDHVLLNQAVFPTAAYIAMAGESMRQISDGIMESYALRDFSVASVMILRPDEKLKLHTSLRHVDVAGEESRWYEFQITSYDGDHWVERCAGKVCPCRAPVSETRNVPESRDAFERHVDSSYWYDVVASTGLKYGESFRGLHGISASLREHKAIAKIPPFKTTTNYILHPVSIDRSLQTLMIAACNGQGRKLGGPQVVREIGYILVSCGEWAELKASGISTENRSDGFTGDVSVVSEIDHPVLLINGCITSTVPKCKSKSENKLFSFVKWENDPTYDNPNQALTSFLPQLDPSILLERLALLHVLDMKRSAGVPGQRYLQKIRDAVISRRPGRFGMISDTSPFTRLDPASRRKLIDLHKAKTNGTKLVSSSALVEQLLTSSVPFSQDSAEKRSILDECHPLVRNNGIVADMLKSFANKNPKLRILELGNGTDETTKPVLNALNSQLGERMYLTYTYAATSLDATNRAKETFKDSSNVNVVFFDIEKPLRAQNLQAGAYDLVITTEFISPTRSVKTSVSCLRQLIHPFGRLLLLDTFPEPEWVSLVKGHLSDWSSMNANASKDEKFNSHVQSTLFESGFVFGSEDDGSSTTPHVFAELKKPDKRPKRITLIVPDRHHPFVNAVQMSFKSSGISVDRCTFGNAIPHGQDIISIVDFGEPYLYSITEAKFRNFADRLCDFKGSMIWVTPSAQVSCKNPNSSMILGMTRTLRAELRKDITVVEIDVDIATYINSSKSLLKIYQGLNNRPKTRDLDPDHEYAIVDGAIKIPRIHWTTAQGGLSSSMGHSTPSESRLQSAEKSTANPSSPLSFRSDASYLLVGGLGGLGRMISTWMVENGARSIMFFSRSAKEGPDTTPFLDELRSQGCEVSTFAGNVTDLSEVEVAVKQTSKPLAGIMQMSGTMIDNYMSQMTFTEWEQCTKPKVQGTWNLHHATSLANLDFFLLFSSIVGVIGQWKQGNYTAANSFLDAFVNYRHGQGLSASVVDVGIMGSIGMAIEDNVVVEKLKDSGYYFCGEQDLINALTIAITHSRPQKDQSMNMSQLGFGFRSTKPITSPSNRVVWKKDPRMAFSHQLGAFGTTTDDEAKQLLEAAYQIARKLD